MISVGIDISKGKSTVCFMKLYGECEKSTTLAVLTMKQLAPAVHTESNGYFAYNT